MLVSHLSKPATSSDSQRDSAHETSGHGVMTRGNEVRSTTHAPRSAQEHGHHEATFMVPPTIMWNFNALPYGRDNPDTKTFPIPGHEQVRLLAATVRHRLMYPVLIRYWFSAVRSEKKLGPWLISIALPKKSSCSRSRCVSVCNGRPPVRVEGTRVF